MCEKCVEIDKEIERYRRIADQVTDDVTLEAIERLIAECHDKKIGLHSSPTKKKQGCP